MNEPVTVIKMKFGGVGTVTPPQSKAPEQAPEPVAEKDEGA
jgi:hypothetical protein